jgi:hypothetical protein
MIKEQEISIEIEKLAEVARSSTGSLITTKQLIHDVNNTTENTKDIICPKVDKKMVELNLPINKALSLMKCEFNEMANDNNMDSAVLFWVYMDWRSKRKK